MKIMNKIRKIIPTLAIFLGLVFVASLISITFSGCYIIQAQTMDNLKGTYKLTRYTTTDKRYVKNEEGKEVVETKVVDELEEHGYQIYLVVTGDNRGWYAYKTKDTDGYIREVELSYTTNSEDSNKYDYVAYKYFNETSSESLGISKKALHQARPAILEKSSGCSNLVIHQVGYDKDWTRISDDTDLSKVMHEDELGSDIAVYEFEAYNLQGVYQRSVNYSYTDSEYDYYYALLDTERETMKATVYYSKKGAAANEVEEKDITLVNGWATIRIGDEEWTRSSYGTEFTRTVEEDGVSKNIALTQQGTAGAESDEAWIQDQITVYWTNHVCDTYLELNDDDGLCATCKHAKTEHELAVCESYIAGDNGKCAECFNEKSEHTFAVCGTYVDEDEDNGLCEECFNEKSEHTFDPCGSFNNTDGDDKCDTCFRSESEHTPVSGGANPDEGGAGTNPDDGTTEPDEGGTGTPEV